MDIGGYKNRILRVNLNDGSFSEEPLNRELIRDYIGGRGFGIKLLYDDLRPGIDPLGEENELIFVTGPLAGTNAQSFGRWKVFFKSPLTGTFFLSSAGGHLAPELKYAGFDVIVITGKAERPVYLWVHDGKYQLRDATYLWGLDCNDTHSLIRHELGDPSIQVACIGPAGEHMVRYAGIFSDQSAAGRGGGGAVMGSKHLKAIAVRGHARVDVADKDAFMAAVSKQVRVIRSNPIFKSFSQMGTQATADVTNLLGVFPTKNFREGALSGWDKISSTEYTALRVYNTGCSNCMLHCKSISKIAKGRYAAAWSHGLQYETIWGFTAPIGASNIGLTIAANTLCNNLGLDSISTATTIGFAYELYDKGIITEKETGGMRLSYGNDRPILKLLRQIAYRKGLGEMLADGVREAARRIGKGTEQYAMHVKGLEMPGYDPRGLKAQGLSLLTASNGADHNAGYAAQELFGTPIPYKVDRFAIEGKAALTKWNQDIMAFTSTGIACGFPVQVGMVDAEIYSQLISAATGVKDFADPAYMWHVGERIFNLERMFNVREGFRRRDDAFPKRITEEPLPDGASAGQVFEAQPLLTEYYKERGWDPETGIPLPAKLNELGLGFAARY